MAVGGAAHITSHLHYDAFTSPDGTQGWRLGNRSPFTVYYEIDWYIRDAQLVKVHKSVKTTARGSTQRITLSGVEWKHTRVVGQIQPADPTIYWVKMDYLLGSGFLSHNDVRWTVRSGTSLLDPSDPWSGPDSHEGEKPLMDPWLGRKRISERDEVEDGEAGEPVTDGLQPDTESGPVDTEPVETVPPPQVVPGPAFSFYRLVARFAGDAHYYMLYKTMVLRYAGADYGPSWSVYQYDTTQARVQLTLQASDGVGVLSLPASGPVFGTGSGQARGIAYEMVGAAIVFKSEDGKYLAWMNTPSLGGGVEGSGASYQLGYTSTAGGALQFALNATS